MVSNHEQPQSQYNSNTTKPGSKGLPPTSLRPKIHESPTPPLPQVSFGVRSPIPIFASGPRFSLLHNLYITNSHELTSIHNSKPQITLWPYNHFQHQNPSCYSWDENGHIASHTSFLLLLEYEWIIKPWKGNFSLEISHEQYHTQEKSDFDSNVRWNGENTITHLRQINTQHT